MALAPFPITFSNTRSAIFAGLSFLLVDLSSDLSSDLEAERKEKRLEEHDLRTGAKDKKRTEIVDVSSVNNLKDVVDK